jgi:hypothetical protein
MGEEVVLQVLIWSPEEPENRFRAKVEIRPSELVNIVLLYSEQLEGEGRQLRFRNILHGIDEKGTALTFMICKKAGSRGMAQSRFGIARSYKILAKFCLHGCYLSDVNSAEFTSVSFKLKGFYPWYNKTIEEGEIESMGEDQYTISDSFNLFFSYSRSSYLCWGQRPSYKLKPCLRIDFTTSQSIFHITESFLPFCGFLHLATLGKTELWELAFHTQDHREIKVSGSFPYLKELGTAEEDISQYYQYAFSWKDLSHDELESLLRKFYSFTNEHADAWEQYKAYVNGNASLESKFLQMARCLEKLGSLLTPSAKSNRQKYEALLERIKDEVTGIGVPFSEQMIDQTVATRNLLTHGSSDPRHVNDEVTSFSELTKLTIDLQRFAYLIIMREIGFPMGKFRINHTRLVSFNVMSFEMDRADQQEEQIVDFKTPF